MTSPHAVVEGLSEADASVLRLVAAALAAGVLLAAGVAGWLYLGGAGRPVPPNGARLVNILTMAAMAWTLAGIAAGEFLWRRLVRAIEEPARAGAAVRSAFIVRLALREGTALLGLVVLVVGALNGVLAAFPAYWVNAAPAALFLFFVWARWPSLDNLREQVKDALPPV
ncbi:MAG: hypothetical protein SF051_08765 [Elusimicrobiota bacterium]|nr:hypothetical protein [Elusimicrobiota bacterium]